MPGAYLYGFDAPIWRKVIVNALGHLQVDVLTSALPAGAASLGAQNVSNDLLSLIFARLGTGVTIGNWPADPSTGGRQDVQTDLLSLIHTLLGTGVTIGNWPADPSTGGRQDVSNDLLSLIFAAQGRCYGWDGGEWLPMLFEADDVQNLRVRLYGGANAVLVGQSSAALAYTNYGIETFAVLYGDDGTNLSRVGMLLAGADAVDNALYTLGTASMLYGYNGGTWDRLRVESAAHPNLRVRLYYSGTPVHGATAPIDIANQESLCTIATVYGRWSAVSLRAVNVLTPAADEHGLANIALLTINYLYGFNGAGWDRLRTYGTGILKVGRAEIDSTTLRKTAAGAVVGGAHNLYWIACSPDGPGSEFELTDAIAGGGAVVFDHFDPDRHSEVLHLDPPMKFATGIWIEKFDHIKSLVFCYI